MERGKLAATVSVVLLVILSVFEGYAYSELSAADYELGRRNNELSTVYHDLSGNYSRLLDSYLTLNVTHNDLQLSYEQLQNQYKELQDLNAEIFETRYETGYQEGWKTGYGEGNSSGFDLGYVAGVADGAGKGYTLRDPTYLEVTRFIHLDQTDKNRYNEDSYVCLDFAADVKNNAFRAGYRCGYVIVLFPDLSHAIVCFNTTDRGLVFIEPQTDDIVNVVIGKPYWERTGYPAPSYNDTVVRFTVAW